MSFDAQHVEQIVSTALALTTPAERVVYLDSTCGADTALRAWVEALIKARTEAATADPVSTEAIESAADGNEGQPVASAAEESTAAESRPEQEQEYAIDFLAPPSQPDSLGRLAHYDILELLGQGGFGIVFKAFDAKLHRMVAIKVLSPVLAASSTARRRFIREAQAAAAVRHEHVITIHAVDEQPVPFLVMEYISGQTLQQKLDHSAPLELKEILRIGFQLASGLAAAHKQGLVHRDIKPGNILLENGIEQVKITDFGLARAVDDASITQSGVVAGTPMYMAPEQAMGEALDHRADLFSLGTVLYVMCTGRPPFRASGTMAILKRVCEDTPRPIREINPEIPECLADVIAKLHAKQPEERYQSAKEVADLLAKYLAEIQTHGQVLVGRAGGVSPLASPQTGVPTHHEADGARSPERWRRWVKIAILLVVAGLLAWRLGPPLVLTARNKAQITVEWDDAQASYSLVAPDSKRVIRLEAGSDEVLPGTYELRIYPPPGKVLDDVSLRHQTMFTGRYEPNLSSPPKELYIGRGDRVTISARFRDAASVVSADEGWRPLFNREDLTGWKTHPDQPGDWRVENGILIGRQPQSYLYSERGDYQDFHLRVEAKINQGGDSGIWFRTPFAVKKAGKDLEELRPAGGYEAELHKNPFNLQRTGSVYGLFAVTDDSLIKADNWFTLEVIAEGNRFITKVNGKQAALCEDRQKKYGRGHVALQVYHLATVVEFRKIEIREMGPNKQRESLIAGWGKAIDPQGDCKFEVNQGRLALTVPAGNHDLNPAAEKNLLAPRVLQEIEGDFTLQAHVRPFALPPLGIENFRAAGLVVWQDGRNYLRLLRAAGLQFFVQAEWWQEGSHGGADGPDAAHLQIQRQGSVLRLRTSNDGKTWETWKTVDLTLSSKVQLGVVAVNTVRESASFEFENLPSQPLVSAGPSSAIAPFDERKAKEHQEAWAKHLGVDVEITNSLDMKLRLIPPGDFLRGTPTKERETMLANLAQDWQKGFVREERQAERASVAQPFYLATTEVTVGQFRKFVKARSYKTTAETNGRGGRVLEGASIEYRPESTWQHETVALSDDHPVVQLSLKDAQEFCRWLSQRDGRTYAMPTEDQWEWACRAGTETPWFSGTEVAAVADVAWTTQNADGTSHPVARKKANPFGLFDLLGNTEELTTSALGVPVSRGGSFGLGPELCRAASRVPVPIEETYYARGFRVAVVGDLRPKTPKSSDAQKLQGTWKLVSVEPDAMTGWIAFSGDKFTASLGQGVGQKGTFRLNAGAQPKEIDFVIDGVVGANTIYELDGDKLTFLQSVPSSPRPKNIAKREPTQTIYRYERQAIDETNPFVILAKDAKAERRHATLLDAVAAAQSGDTIEIHGDGPFVTRPINIKDVALAIRAAEGFRPVVTVAQDGQADGGPCFLTTDAPLVLEGLEIRQMETRVGVLIHSAGASLHVAHCRFLKFPLFADLSPRVEIRHCEFIGEMGPDNNSLFARLPPRGQLLADDNLMITGKCCIVFVGTRADLRDCKVDLRRNTLFAQIAITFGVDALPDAAAPGSSVKPIKLTAFSNIFHGGKSALDLWYAAGFVAREKPLSPSASETFLQRALAWEGRGNLYPSGVPSLLTMSIDNGEKLKPLPSVKGLADWQKFWRDERDRIEGLPKYQGGNLPTRLASGIENLQPAHFRLADGSPGKGAGKDGKDLGADVDLVGPGTPYQRWQQTAEYQDWLKRTGQPPRGKEAVQPPRAVAPFDKKQAK